MATSNIKTGLRLVQIPNSNFSWNDTNKVFTCSKTNATTNTGLTTVVGYLINGNANLPMWSCSVYPDLGSNYLQVSGWFAKAGASVSSSNNNDFTVYAIGY